MRYAVYIDVEGDEPKLSEIWEMVAWGLYERYKWHPGRPKYDVSVHQIITGAGTDGQASDEMDRRASSPAEAYNAARTGMKL